MHAVHHTIAHVRNCSWCRFRTSNPRGPWCGSATVGYRCQRSVMRPTHWRGTPTSTCARRQNSRFRWMRQSGGKPVDRRSHTRRKHTTTDAELLYYSVHKPTPDQPPTLRIPPCAPRPQDVHSRLHSTTLAARTTHHPRQGRHTHRGHQFGTPSPRTHSRS